jgi:hypothetical protein
MIPLCTDPPASGLTTIGILVVAVRLLLSLVLLFVDFGSCGNGLCKVAAVGVVIVLV